MPKAPPPRTTASAPPRGAPSADHQATTRQPAAPAALALTPTVDNAALEALRAAGIDIESDKSCAELVPSDFRTPRKMFNLKNKVDGQQRRQDRFYDSVTNEEQESIDFAILGLHKSNSYDTYDAGEGRSNRICSSFDQVTGTWAEDGHQRQCEGCPDKRAVKQPDGKVRANCAELVDVAAVEVQNSRLFMLRGKRMNRPPLLNYMHQYHYGKAPGRGNLPSYLYRVSARLEMDAKGNYATLVLEKGEMFSPNDLRMLRESSDAVAETWAQRLAESEAADGGDGGSGGGGGDTSFDYGANAGEPQKFVNAP